MAAWNRSRISTAFTAGSRGKNLLLTLRRLVLRYQGKPDSREKVSRTVGEPVERLPGWQVHGKDERGNPNSRGLEALVFHRQYTPINSCAHNLPRYTGMYAA